VDRGARAVEAARGWIGTPFRHGASLQGAGCDCLGLLRGVWRDVVGPEPETVGPYAETWAETGDAGRLMDGLSRRLARIAADEAAPGDVALLRLTPGGPAKHLGILADGGAAGPTLIHAWSGRGVVESPFAEGWRRRMAAAFRLPEGE
jgi:NlpC/P60 family putative phage cell wall peptidase